LHLPLVWHEGTILQKAIRETKSASAGSTLIEIAGTLFDLDQASA
jgi:hypothetical protein